MTRRSAATTVASFATSTTTCLCRRARPSRTNASSSQRRSLNTSPRHRHDTARQPAPRRGPDRRRYATATPQKRDGSEIAIVGAGLTGLTAAYYLAKLVPSANITIYESAARAGGWMHSEKVRVDTSGVKGEVMFERGPRTLQGIGSHLDDHVLIDLSLDLGLRFKAQGGPQLPRYLYYPDRLVALPFKSADDVGPLVYESLWPATKALFNLTRSRWGMFTLPSPEEDVSISQWMDAVTGVRGGLSTPVSAVLHGIYGGNIDKLSFWSVFGHRARPLYLGTLGDDMTWMSARDKAFVNAMSKDPLVRQMRQKKWPSVMSLEGGMESLPLALADALKSQPNVTFSLKDTVKWIGFNRVLGNVEISSSGNSNTQVYDKVIATMDGQALASVTQGKLPSLAEIPSVSIMVVNLFYPKEIQKPRGQGLGYLIPRTVAPEMNPERALGVFFDSDVNGWEPDEPKGGTKLTVLMGGHYYGTELDPPSEDEAIRQAKAVLERHLGIPHDTPAFATARLAKNCIPQANVGHGHRLMRARAALTTDFGGRLAVAGGAYSRIGVMGALRAGHDAARKIANGDWQGTGLPSTLWPEMVQVKRSILS